VLAWHEIDLVLDVGANVGQFGAALRSVGYRRRIVSFEPLSEAFEGLAPATAGDPLWEALPVALGATHRKAADLHVSQDLEASSLLEMEERHVRHWPPSAYVGTEVVAVHTLDALTEQLGLRHRRIYLKLDVQGYELEVLRGVAAVLPHVVAVEAEVSLVPLYSGAPLYREVVDHLSGLGFALVSIEGITEEPESGQMLQLDAIFGRAASAGERER